MFDEFEEYETAESKFAHAMDNIQPLILNNSNNGGDWREHNVTAEQFYKRQSKTKLGSERLFKVTDTIIKDNRTKLTSSIKRSLRSPFYKVNFVVTSNC